MTHVACAMTAAIHHNIKHNCMQGQMNMALILYPDGTSKEVHPANGDHFEIEELVQIVEGTIQMIPLPDGRIMTLNEEGGRVGLPPNEQATALAGFPFNEGLTKSAAVFARSCGLTSRSSSDSSISALPCQEAKRS